MSEVKTFRIQGEVRKQAMKMPFVKEVRAIKEGDALEKVYVDLGSRHKAKRFEIRIIRVEEVKAK